jgi:putative sporulation protein YtxC
MLNVSFSCNEFKLYKNIIIHYTGIDTELFYNKLATILSYLVIDNFENNIIKNILLSNYFYFDNTESSKILDICEENLCDEEFSFQNRQMALFDAFFNYITTHHSIVLSGFINFRLFNYRNLLENLVNLSVNEFIIEREYLEFISLVKLYVNSQPPCFGTVHIVYLDSGTFLLDENMAVISVDKNDLNAKFLSDVSFSDNDYILNTLLNLLPIKIFVHISSSSINLDFINTLDLIFDNRLEICTDCNICNLYKNLNIKQKK